MGFISKQFLDIIEWEDEGQDIILYKFPMEDNEIQTGAKLVVRPGQCAIFVDRGQIADVFQEPGTYSLNTSTLPVLADLLGWAYMFESPFKSDVYFVNTKQFIDQKWGTPSPVLIPDPKFEQVEIKAYGTFAFRVTEPKVFLKQVSGTNEDYTVETIRDQLKAFIISCFAPAVANQNVPVAELVANYSVIDQVLEKAVQAEFKTLGLELTLFNILSITLQEEYREMIRKRGAVNIMGGMQNYTQVETLEVMKESAQNPGVNGMAQAGMGAGLGLGLGNVLAQGMQSTFQGMAAAHVIECTNCHAKVPAGSAFCNKCGTGLAAAGSQADLFCNKCGYKVNADSLFCSKCGNKL